MSLMFCQRPLSVCQTKPTVVHRVNERTLSPVQEPGAVAVDDDSHPSAGALLVCLHKAQVL